MNYKVLYRKYRPNDFETIIGQEYIVKTLKNSIINGNISHAYIFSGPRGTGKTSTAKVFAKAINCLSPVDGSPCGKCEFCINFHDNPDIIEIDAASNNGVDEIRNLIDNVKLTPSNGKYKVYIIDEVHMLTTSAFNALLLTLEEPPAHVIFIFATTNIENVPITILSRCQRFDFQKITVENIEEALKAICKKEKIKITDEALSEIAYISDGGMRDALSLLDQLSKNGEKITLELIESQIRIISKKSIEDILNALEQNDIESFLKYVNDFKIRAVDYKTLVKKIIDGLSARAKKIKENKISSRLNFSDYKNLIINLSESITKININVDSYIIFEMIFLEFFDTNIKKPEKILKIVEEPKESKEEKKKNNKDLVKIRINNCFVNAKKEHLQTAKEEISKMINLATLDGKTKAILIDSNVVAASDKYIILTCLNEHDANSFNAVLSDIEQIIKKSSKKDYKIIFITEDEWKNKKEEYISNIKSGKKYEYMEEIELNEETNIINDVFDKMKVEVI